MQSCEAALDVVSDADLDVMVLLDGEVLPIVTDTPVEWHAGFQCFVVKVDLT